jgi:hypothetical protein
MYLHRDMEILIKGCQIFLVTTYQRVENIPHHSKAYLHRYTLAIKYVKGQKYPNDKNITTFSIPKPSKIFPNWDFWYENIPSGNPGYIVVIHVAERLIECVQLVNCT